MADSQTLPFLDLKREHGAYRDELIAALCEVVDRGVFILGPKLEQFEAAFADYLGAAHCVAVGNGQDALELCLKAMGIGAEDEVVVPAMTFVATAGAVVLSGATPVLCDVDDHGLMDPADLETRITSRTRVIVPVHLHGRCANMQTINAIAKRHNIKVLEDACQAHGATFRGKKAGCLADAAAFSFYPTKNLGALGDGGALVTNDDALAAKVRSLRNYGSRQKYVHEVVGRNSRLDELQAAALLVRLRHLEDEIEKRRAIARQYRDGLRDVPLRLPQEEIDSRHVYHVYSVGASTADDRAGLEASLMERKIGTLRHYPLPLHRQPCFPQWHSARFPGAEKFAEISLSLPMFATLSLDECQAVTTAIREFCQR